MNSLPTLRGPLLAAGLLLSVSLSAAEPTPASPPVTPGGPPPAPQGPARRPGPRSEAGPARTEMERATFLGVQVAGVPPVLGAQLGLAPETGLAVVQLAPRSPAAGALKLHDVLTRFDDQHLIDAHQLAVLVRNRQEGDEVILTVMRAGQRMTVKVRLGTHEEPRPGPMGPMGPGGGRRMGPGGPPEEDMAPASPDRRGRAGGMMGPDGRRGPFGPADSPLPPRPI